MLFFKGILNVKNTSQRKEWFKGRTALQLNLYVHDASDVDNLLKNQDRQKIH